MKGSHLKIERAKESFIERLKRERQQVSNQSNKEVYENNENKNITKEQYNKKLREFSLKFNDKSNDFINPKINDIKQKKRKKKECSSDSDSDVEIKRGIPMFKGTQNLNLKDPPPLKPTKKSKYDDNRAAEKQMMVDFKKFSSVWGDSDSEPDEKENSRNDSSKTDMGIFSTFNKAKDKTLRTAVVFKKSNKVS